MSLLRRLAEARSVSDFGGWGPWADGTIPPPSLADGDFLSGPFVSERTALGLVDVYACVSLLADTISTLPFDAYRRSGDHRVEVTPTPSLVAQPDPEISRIEFLSRAVTSLLLRGNIYAPITARDALGYATAATVVHPDDVHPRRNARTGRKEYRLRNGEVVAAADMIHVPWLTLAGELAGIGPIECARRGLRLSIGVEEFGERYFREGATPSSALETDQNLEDDQRKRVMANWMQSHGGRRRPALLTGGLKWRAISITPNESQFLETRGYQGAFMARLFRVPPHMVGIVDKTSSWGKGIEELGIGFVVFTLATHLARLEDAFTRQLPRPQFSKFTVGALLRGNTKDRMLSYAIARQWGWMSVNDIRRLEDLAPIGPEGDSYLVPLNMADAEKALTDLVAQAAAEDAEDARPPAA